MVCSLWFVVDHKLQTKNYKQACEILSDLKSYSAQSKTAYQMVHFHYAEILYDNKEFTESENYFKKSLKYVSDKKLEGEVARKRDKSRCLLLERGHWVGASHEAASTNFD